MCFENYFFFPRNAHKKSLKDTRVLFHTVSELTETFRIYFTSLTYLSLH